MIFLRRTKLTNARAWTRRLRCACALVLCASPLTAVAETLTVRDLRYWSHPGFTRVVVELSGARSPKVERLENPTRLYLDFDGVKLPPQLAKTLRVNDGLLRRVRFAQNTLQRARLVLDLDRYGRHRLFTLPAPSRVVLDVYGTSARARARNKMPTAARAEKPVTVVLDPGHGGRDPGAIGVGGLREKDLTLAVALDLRKRLRARGFRVVMTREADDTLSLEERTARAEGAGGDVFISLHANAARRGAHGVETYYLDSSNEHHTLRVAARESGVAPSELDALDRELSKLRLTDTSRASAALASGVHKNVVGQIEKVFSSVRDLGVKQGPFHVLFLSSVPAVLIEMGFVTNPREARRLRRPLYQQVVAEQIARALSSYRREQQSAGQPG